MASQAENALHRGYTKNFQPELAMIEHRTASSSSKENGLDVQPVEKNLFENGLVNLIPMPTADPKGKQASCREYSWYSYHVMADVDLDPLNLPDWRKVTAILSLCLFGSMAAAAELILGAMLPVFSFEYADINPKILVHIHLPSGINGLTALSAFPGPPIWEIYLLGSLPILMIGVANFFLVPLSIALGRRTILLGTGMIALAGCVASGFTHSLGAHLACRVIQALGAGTVESLIPFIIQDMVFYHQRNAAISVVFATQVCETPTLSISSQGDEGRHGAAFGYIWKKRRI